MTFASLALFPKSSSGTLLFSERIIPYAFFFIALTGLRLPVPLSIFDLFAATALFANFHYVVKAKPSGQAWLFSGLTICAYLLHITQQDVPLGNSFIFVQGAISCLLLATLLGVCRLQNHQYEKILAFYLLGTLLSVAAGLAMIALPTLKTLPFLAEEIGNSGRAYGFSKHSNLLSLHCAVCLVLLRSIPLLAGFKLVAAIGLITGLVVSGSRSGLLLVLLAIFFALFLARSFSERKRVLVIVAGLAVVSFLAVTFTEAGAFFYSRATGQAGVTGDYERTYLLETGMRQLEQHWLFGSPYEGRLFHNIYLTYPAMLGVLGIVALLLFFARSIFAMWKLRFCDQGRVALAVFFAFLVTLSVHNAVAEPVIWLVALAPTLLTAPRHSKTSHVTRRKPARRQPIHDMRPSKEIVLPADGELFPKQTYV